MRGMTDEVGGRTVSDLLVVELGLGSLEAMVIPNDERPRVRIFQGSVI